MKETSVTAKGLFVVLIFILIVGVAIVAVIVALEGGGSGAAVINGDSQEGLITIKNINGTVEEVPNFKSAAVSTYDKDLFVSEPGGIMRYNSEDATIGISVSERQGVIDWDEVKASGIDFVLIRCGRRGYTRGQIAKDANFEQNIEGATAAGLGIGVYFYSKAITEKEAEEEAVYVLEAIRDYQVVYPVAIYWEYTVNYSEGEIPREQSCTPDQVSSFVNAFCKKISKANYNASFYANKEMAYETFNLDLLSKYQIWYAETEPLPSLYYDFALWQYTTEGTVPGIATSVRMDIAFKKY